MFTIFLLHFPHHWLYMTPASLSIRFSQYWCPLENSNMLTVFNGSSTKYLSYCACPNKEAHAIGGGAKNPNYKVVK
jgi:hypothetical protein